MPRETNLLANIVAIDARIMEATSRAGRTTNDLTFEKIMADIRILRAERAELQAKLYPNGR